MAADKVAQRLSEADLAIVTALESTERALTEISRGAGGAEATLAKRKLQEASFWITEAKNEAEA